MKPPLLYTCPFYGLAYVLLRFSGGFLAPIASGQPLRRKSWPGAITRHDTIADMHEGTGSEPGLSDAQGAQRHYALTMRTLVDARGVDEADLPASFI